MCWIVVLLIDILTFSLDTTNKSLFDLLFVLSLVKEAVIDLLQTIVEIVTYGDRQDPLIFEYALHMLHLSMYDFFFQCLCDVIWISSFVADVLWNTKF